MKSGETESYEGTDLVLPSPIRVETALSRYPVHRIAKQGTASIEIHERNESGTVVVKWEVSHNSRFGQPGPLAYKLDTLIVNRRIEEASRPIPKIIKLGSLTALIEELGLTNHDTQPVKKALFQNASVFITAKLDYRHAEGGTKELEAGFNRYSVVFTGEELPDGRRADAVYLVLSDVFMQVLNGAQTRPLDYDYLKDLPPGPQRLYEILSYRMYAALKNGRPRAKLGYGEFCTHAPLTRHLEWLRVRTQMNKLHAPHKKSGYIASVEFEQTTDRDGKPDWSMLYTPGPKARAEFRAFDKKGGPRTLVVEQSPPALEILPHQVEASPLERELIERGIAAATAAELAASYPEEQIAAQVEHFDWLKSHQPKKVAKSEGGFLAEAIRKNYPTPKGFESKAEREKRETAERLKRKQEHEEARRRGDLKRREEDLERRVSLRWESMTPEKRAALEAEALATADDETRRQFEDATPKFQPMLLTAIRRGYLRQLVQQEESASDAPDL